MAVAHSPLSWAIASCLTLLRNVIFASVNIRYNWNAMKGMSRIITLLAILLIIVVAIGATIAFFYLPENMQGVVLGITALALLNLLLVLGFTRYNDKRGRRRK
ncbi:hypothetical protein [Porphyromonas gingivicanis]|nr:hypothetical protein [Porphyromonas gingivicanis]